MKSTITITQIAQESGVSVATVSRFLNGKVPVSADKKARIEAVVRKYDFTPNALARGLISKRTMTLGVILPDITNPYFATIFQEVQRCAAEEGYSVYLCNTRFHHGDAPIDETGYFRMMMDKKVDGILIIGGQLDMAEISPAYKEALNKLSASLPVVAAGARFPVPAASLLTQRTEAASRLPTTISPRWDIKISPSWEASLASPLQRPAWNHTKKLPPHQAARYVRI